MIRMMMLIPAVATLLACGLIARSDDSAKPQVTGDIVVGQAPGGGSAPPQATGDIVVGPPPGGGSAPPPSGDLPLPLYAGDSLIEEKIMEYPIIVKGDHVFFLVRYVALP